MLPNCMSGVFLRSRMAHSEAVPVELDQSNDEEEDAAVTGVDVFADAVLHG